MEKSSKLLIPLAAVAAITSADNAFADGPASAWGPALMGREREELSDSAKFCEELRYAKGPDIKDYVIYFSPELQSRFGGIRMTIEKRISAVMKNGDEAILSCVYDANKSGGDVKAPEGIPVNTFSKRLFLPNGPTLNFTAVTSTAEYIDDNTDGFPDTVNFLDQNTIFDYIAIRGTEDGPVEQPNGLCVEGEDPDLCKELGVGLSDFDAAIAAGRRALAITPEEEIDDE